MKVSDDLFQLIKSLDKNERRYFRLFASMQSGSKQYMKLFEAIDAQTRYSEEEIRARFADQQFVRQLAVAKNYLYNLILKCLALYHAGYGNQIDRLLQQAEILRCRALYRQALKLVERAERLAEETGDDARMLLVLEERRDLLEKVSPTSWNRTRSDHDLRLRRAIGSLSMIAAAGPRTSEPGTAGIASSIPAPQRLGAACTDPACTDPICSGTCSGGLHEPEAMAANGALGRTGAPRSAMRSVERSAAPDNPRDEAAGKSPANGSHVDGSPGNGTAGNGTAIRGGNGEARIEILREMLLASVDAGRAELAAEARRELQGTIRSETRADGIRLTAAAALEIASLLEQLGADGVPQQSPAGALALVARDGGRLIVRDLLQLQMLIALHHLLRGDLAAALAGATELRAHPELPAYPDLRLATALLVPILRSRLGDRRGADGALAAAGRALLDMDLSGASAGELTRLLANLLAAPVADAARERLAELRRNIPPLAGLPGLPAALDRALARLGEPA